MATESLGEKNNQKMDFVDAIYDYCPGEFIIPSQIIEMKLLRYIW